MSKAIERLSDLGVGPRTLEAFRVLERENAQVAEWMDYVVEASSISPDAEIEAVGQAAQVIEDAVRAITGTDDWTK
jgi:CHASE3 domain sensor protein